MTDRRCETCYWWGLYKGGQHSPISLGPFGDEKPAKECKRFPPTNLWGANAEAQAFGIGKSFNTFADDFCGEWKPHADEQAAGETK